MKLQAPLFTTIGTIVLQSLPRIENHFNSLLVVELLIHCEKNSHLAENSQPSIYKPVVITSPTSFDVLV